ncbi:hypothetical protein BGZ94_008642 [Podila epigama]|nr:hypothetical protein BGZ94_008642 [Podila epigama]
MDAIIQLYTQDPTGATLRAYLDEVDANLEDSDHIFNLVIKSLENFESLHGGHNQEHQSLYFIRAIIRASPEEGEGASRRVQVLKASVEWLLQAGNAGTAQRDEFAEKLVNTLVDFGQSFPLGALVQSIHTVSEAIRQQRHPNRSTFALLSRILVIAANADVVTLQGSHEQITGSEFRAFILDRICTAPWNPKSILPLATVLGDVDMESKQLEMAIVKVMKQFKYIDATDLPHLIYSLLLLSSKGHQRLVIRGILEFFDRLDSGGIKAECLHSDNQRGASRLDFAELSAVQSTVILHFSFAVKQDQELGIELLKHMKSGKTAFLSSFSLTCLLTMARIHRFEDGVMDYLKSSILNIYKDEDRILRETWAASYQGISPPNMLDMFRNVIRKIPYGLEQITQSMVHCGVYIMDSMAPTSPWRTSENIVPKRTKSKPSERACELGAAILAETFKTQESVRPEILDHIMSRVVTKSSSTMFFLELLETIVEESTDALIEHLPRIKESLDYLSFLSLPTALRLMAAVKEVAKINRSFRDSLILILRKALFSKSVESRQVALSGLLLLLELTAKSQQSLRGGPSRAGGDFREAELSSGSLEILGMLRRCLGQQGDIRLALYIRLMNLIDTSPALVPVIFELLHAHFLQFYDCTGTRLSPLKLDECVANARTGGEPVLIEPLQYLMSGVIRSLVGLRKAKSKASRDTLAADPSQVEACYADMDKLLASLDRAGLEDFELDKSSDFHMGSNIGMRNNMYASLLIGCFESAIEYVVLTQQTQTAQSANGKGTATSHRRCHSEDGVRLSAGSAELILHLFGKMRKLHDIVREKVVLPRGRKMGPLGEASVLGPECLTRLLEFIFAQPVNPVQHDPEAQKLKANDDFMYYITTVVHVSLSKIQTSAETLRDIDYDYCRRLSCVLVREFLTNGGPDGPRMLAAGAKGKDKNKSWLMVGIEALTSGMLIVQRFYPVSSAELGRQGSAPYFPARMQSSIKIVCGFLAATLPQVNGGHPPDQQLSDVVAWTTSRTIKLDLDSLAAAYVQYLQEIFHSLVNETMPLVKEAVGVLNLIQILSQYLRRPSFGGVNSSDTLVRADSTASTNSETTGETRQLDQLVHWLVRVCRDQPIDDSSLAKTLLSMMLSLEQECSAPEENAALMAFDDQGQPGSSRQPYDAAPSHRRVLEQLGIVSAASAVSNCPVAATRLRLAADVLITYNMNYGAGLQSIPDQVEADMDGIVEEDLPRLVRLKQEIGLECRFSVMTMRTAASVTDLLLVQVENALDSLEWAIVKLRYCGLSQLGGGGALNARGHEDHSPEEDACNPLLTLVTSEERMPLSKQLKSAQAFEAEICWRVEVCMWVLIRIAQAAIPNVAAEHLIKVLSKCYKVLTTLTKQYLNPLTTLPTNLFEPTLSSSKHGEHISGGGGSSSSSRVSDGSGGSRQRAGHGSSLQLPHGLLRVTQVAGTELSKHIYNFLTYFQALDQELQERNFARQTGPKKKAGDKTGKGKGGFGGEDGADDDGGDDERRELGQVPTQGMMGNAVKTRQKAKILRESKLIPDLIFVVEQYERYVIQLSKKSKVHLTQYLRRSTARDFRIQIQRLGDLGLEDRYGEERQMLALQRQQGQQGQQGPERQSIGEGAHVQMEGVHEHETDVALNDAVEDMEEEGEDVEESLVRSRKRARH